jgi:hypothetical protein
MTILCFQITCARCLVADFPGNFSDQRPRYFATHIPCASCLLLSAHVLFSKGRPSAAPNPKTLVHRGHPLKHQGYGTRQKYYLATQLPISFSFFYLFSSDGRGEARP